MTDSNKIEILLSTIDRHWSQAIQSESQRASMTNYLITICGAAQAYIIQRNYDSLTIIISIIFLLLSVYGVIACYKYYERFRLHASRVGRLMDKLDELDSSINLTDIEKTADIKHKNKFPKLSKIRLYKVWLFLHYGFLVIAVFNLVIAVLKNCFEIKLFENLVS